MAVGYWKKNKSITILGVTVSIYECYIKLTRSHQFFFEKFLVWWSSDVFQGSPLPALLLLGAGGLCRRQLRSVRTHAVARWRLSFEGQTRQTKLWLAAKAHAVCAELGTAQV